MVKPANEPTYQSGRCTVCKHPARTEIDRALINGVPYRTLAATHGLSASALFRHTRHIRHRLMFEEQQAEQSQVTAFLDRLELLEFRLDRIFHKAEDAHSFHISLGCLQESFRLLSLREKIRQSRQERR